MKRTFAIALALVMLLTVFPLSVFATNIDNEETGSGVKVYNGAGVFVGEYDSVQDFERAFLSTRGTTGLGVEPRGPIEWLLAASAVYGVISMINDACYMFTGIDPKVWIRENVVVPFTNELKNMDLYSLSGGITNPYPPNSSQYHEFNRTNYYWVVQE